MAKKGLGVSENTKERGCKDSVKASKLQRRARIQRDNITYKEGTWVRRGQATGDEVGRDQREQATSKEGGRIYGKQQPAREVGFSKTR